MFRCHFTIKALFWDTFIQGTPSFKSHIVPPAPPKASSCNLFISYLYSGDICPGPDVILRMEDPLYGQTSLIRKSKGHNQVSA